MQEGRDRSALHEIFQTLDQDPQSEAALRLAVLLLGGSRSAQMQSVEPISQNDLIDRRLDPIYTMCSQCKNNMWISINWQHSAARMVVTNPIGLQCQDCGYVVCRECLNKTIKMSLGPETYPNRCPNCGKNTLGTPVYPTGRTGLQMERRADSISHVFLFREGPLPPDPDYMKEILAEVSPDVLDSNCKLSGLNVWPWPEEIASYAIAYVYASFKGKLDLDKLDCSGGKDYEGNQIYIVKIYNLAAFKLEAASGQGFDFQSKDTAIQSLILQKPGFFDRVRSTAQSLFSRDRRINQGAQTGVQEAKPDLRREESSLEPFIQELLSAHLGRVLNGPKKYKLSNDAKRILHDLAQPPIVQKVSDIALAELKNALHDDHHHKKIFNDRNSLFIISAVPTLKIDKIRSYFPGSYGDFLKKEINTKSDALVHWILCSNRLKYQIYLTIISKEGLVIWPEEIFASVGKISL